jgi:hypothetical protein
MTVFRGPNAFRNGLLKPGKEPKIIPPYQRSPNGVIKVAKGFSRDSGGQSGLRPVLEVAGGGGGGGEVLLVSLDFITQTYTVDGVSTPVTDLLGTEPDYGTNFDPASITENGLEGTTEGFGTPSIIGPLRDAIFRTGGSSIIFSGNGTTINFTVTDGPDFTNYFSFEANEAPSQSRLRFYPNFTGPITTNFTGNTLTTDPTNQAISLAGMSVETDTVTLSVNGGVAETASFDPFSFVHIELGIPYYCQSIKVYELLSAANLASLTTS